MPTTAEIVLSSGKWYYEVAITLGPEVTSTDAVLLGVVADRNSLDKNTSGHTDLTSDLHHIHIYYQAIANSTIVLTN